MRSYEAALLTQESHMEATREVIIEQVRQACLVGSRSVKLFAADWSRVSAAVAHLGYSVIYIGDGTVEVRW